MDRSAFSAMHSRLPPALLLSLAVFTTLLSGCDRQKNSDSAAEVSHLKAEAAESGRKLNDAEKSLAAKTEEVATLSASLDTAKTQLAEKDQVVIQQDAQIRVLQVQIETLKKGDAIVFAEISALRQTGKSVLALNGYQKFLNDFPKSPLATHAATAIAELTAENARDTKRWAEVLDPKRREIELAKTLGDGFSTLEELAPILKRKTLAQILALLGRPTQKFHDGNEIGYDERVFNPATGRKGMLVISFDSGVVSTLRVDYAGRRMTP